VTLGLMGEMAGVRTFLVYWLPVVVLMGLIFSASTDAMAEHRTSRFLVPFLRWLLPSAAEETIRRIHTVVRKGGHVTEYALLGILLWRALRKPLRNDPRPWSWGVALWALMLAGLYAASDEFHQSFVPTRWGSYQDVVIDVMGAAAGILLVWLVSVWRRS
jgi:VanZ family protein